MRPGARHLLAIARWLHLVSLYRDHAHPLVLAYARHVLKTRVSAAVLTAEHPWDPPPPDVLLWLDRIQNRARQLIAGAGSRWNA